MSIKYCCSLGPLCHTSQFLKDNNLKNVLIHLTGFFQMLVILFIV